MELKINIGYNQVINLIKQLPASQIAKLKAELNDKFLEKKSKTEISEFQKFLLSGPIMTEKQHLVFKENRKQFNRWRQK